MFRAVRATAQRISTLTVASVVALSSLATAAPLFFTNTAEALALSVSPTTHTVDAGETAISTSDAASYDSLVLEFHVDAKKIDAGEVFAYGWQATGGAANALGSITGVTGDGNNPDEVKTITVSLPAAAAISNLELYFANQADSNGASDRVEVTNITLNGTSTPVTPAPVSQLNAEEFVATDGTYKGISVGFNVKDFGTVTDVRATIHRADSSTVTKIGNAGVLALASNSTSAVQLTTPFVIQEGSFTEASDTFYWQPAPASWTTATTPVKVVISVTDENGTKTVENTNFLQNTLSHPSYLSLLPPAPSDTVSPTITIKPASSSIGYNGVYRKISFKLQDNVGVKRWSINGGAWVNVTVNKYGDVNNKYVGNNGIVNGSNVITLEDTSGNATSLTFYMNNVGPTITVKPSSVGSTTHQIFSEVDFALQDPNHVDRLTLNGVEKDLTNNQWSDLNNVKPGQFGAIVGANTLIVFDGIGNSSTYTFTLDDSAPQIHIKSADNGYTPFSTGNSDVYSRVNFKLHDNTLVYSFSINDGEFTELTPNAWSDVNNVRVGHLGAVAGWNTITVRDIAGNESSLDFFLDGTAPTVSVKGVDNAYTPESSPVEGEEDTFTEVSFKLFDANKIDKVTINGVEKDLSDDKWSDVNFVSPGVFGAQLGLNVLVAYDIAGNTTTYEFTLVEPTTDPDNGQGGGDDEGEGEESTPPAEEPVAPPVITAVLTVAQLITGANDGSRVLASNSANNQSQTDGQVQAAETTSDENAVDGAVDEDDKKLVEDAGSVLDYWWIVLLALIGLFWIFAAKRRKNDEK